MGKDKLNFDFDDIVGEKTTIKSVPPPIEKKKKPTNLSGITLSVPTEEAGKYLSKDMLACTNEEFITWAKAVYPGMEDIKPEEVTSQKTRLGFFKAIQRFHMASMFGKNPENSKTMH